MPASLLPPYLATYPTFPSGLVGRTWPLTRTPQWNNIRQRSTSGKDYFVGLYSTPLRSWTYKYGVLAQRQKYSSIDTVPNTDALVDWDNVISDDEAALEGFYNYCQGGLTPFYFQDPLDYAVSQNQFGVGDGNTTQFQLTRNQGGFVETVQSPSGTPVNAAFWTGNTSIVAAGVAITPSNNWMNLNGSAPYFTSNGSGQTGVREPNWNLNNRIPGTTIQDGSVTWTCQGPALVVYSIPNYGGTFGVAVPQPTSTYTVNSTGLITIDGPIPVGFTIAWTGEFYWLCRFDKDSVDFSADFYRLWTTKLSWTLFKQ